MSLEPGRLSAAKLLERMFDVESRFPRSNAGDAALLATAFAEVLRFKGDRLIEGMPFYYDTAEIVAAIT